MNFKVLSKRGFTLIEVLITIAILGIILSITTISFNNIRDKKNLEITVDSIGSKLEEAKTNALTGKDGSNFGLQFNSDSYVYFSGNSYNSSDSNNKTFTIPNNITVVADLQSGGQAIVFSRLTGIPQTTGTITISVTDNASSTASISIGTLGDINITK